MNIKSKDEIIKTIQVNQKLIQKYGVQKIGLFGSHARGEATYSSDVDFLIDLNAKTFDNYMGLKIFLEELLNCKVDLVLPHTIRPALRDAILKEVIYA